MPKYTDEQIERAKNVDVQQFLEEVEGYKFHRSGRYLKCANPEQTGQPSSLAIDTNSNRIYYNSVTGNKAMTAIDWCKEIKDMDFPSSVRLILGEEPQGERVERPKYQQHRVTPHHEHEKKTLELPEKSENVKNAYAYLVKERGISPNIVNDCIKQGIVYQDTFRNAVFVGKDDNGQAQYAARRGTWTPPDKQPFKRDAIGSDKNFAFKMVGKDTSTIYVTEAAIDAMSLATLEDNFKGQNAYKEKTFLSTGGAGIDNAIEQFCKTHTVQTINICFDNDEAGKNGMEKIMQKFREQGYEVNDMRAEYAHDYNDELKAFQQDENFYPTMPKPVQASPEQAPTISVHYLSNHTAKGEPVKLTADLNCSEEFVKYAMQHSDFLKDNGFTSYENASDFIQKSNASIALEMTISNDLGDFKDSKNHDVSAHLLFYPNSDSEVLAYNITLSDKVKNELIQQTDNYSKAKYGAGLDKLMTAISQKCNSQYGRYKCESKQGKVISDDWNTIKKSAEESLTSGNEITVTDMKTKNSITLSSEDYQRLEGIPFEPSDLDSSIPVKEDKSKVTEFERNE